MKTKFILSLFIASLFAMNVQAQTPENKWGVGLNFGLQQYAGDLGPGFYDFSQAPYVFGGLSVARNLSEHFDLEFNTTFGDIGYWETPTLRFNHRMYQFNFNVKYNFFKYDDVALRPFVFAGLGYLHLEDHDSDFEKSNMQLPDFGFGLTYKVSPKVSIVFKETFMYTDYDKADFEFGGPNDSYLQHSLGVVFNFGKAPDADGDGVSDRHDLCPDAAGLEAFQGCPDSDGDGVQDSEDACPDQAGLPELNGCPDSDGDGVADAQDRCPDAAGTVALGGCPDADGDGVADIDDACPDQAGLAAFNGCPDTDGDGVKDADDRCPNAAGPLALNGCPDSDGDGVADLDDPCPEVAGIMENKGCPEVKEEEKEVLSRGLHGIKYQSGKSVLTSSSYKVLNELVEIMNNNPAYKLNIAGHTDSQGNADFNMDLSLSRAQAVVNYLVESGIDASRLNAEGFGETKPIADNATAAGRAENRRVEMEIIF